MEYCGIYFYDPWVFLQFAYYTAFTFLKSSQASLSHFFFCLGCLPLWLWSSQILSKAIHFSEITLMPWYKNKDLDHSQLVRLLSGVVSNLQALLHSQCGHSVSLASLAVQLHNSTHWSLRICQSGQLNMQERDHARKIWVLDQEVRRFPWRFLQL